MRLEGEGGLWNENDGMRMRDMAPSILRYEYNGFMGGGKFFFFFFDGMG